MKSSKLPNEVSLVQTERVEIKKSDMPYLWDVPPGPCKEGTAGYRGQLSGQVRFSEPFVSPPEVIMALDTLDVSKADNLRILALVTKVAEAGFDYQLLTWCKTQVWRARASWIAIGDRPTN